MQTLRIRFGKVPEGVEMEEYDCICGGFHSSGGHPYTLGGVSPTVTVTRNPLVVITDKR